MNVNKILNIVLGVIVAISAILVISLVSNLSENNADATMGAWINTNLTWAYILFFGCAVIAVLAALVQVLTDKAALKSSLVTLAVFGVIGLVAYSLADSTIPKFPGVEKFVEGGLTTSSVKWISTSLIVTYILFILAFAAMAVAPIINLFKK